MRYLLSGIVYLAVYLGAGALLRGYPLAQSAVANILLLALALTFCVVVLYRRGQWQGAERLFWDAFAVGMALWCVGQIGFTVNALTGHVSWVQWHTMFSLCGGIGPVVAMIARPYLGPRKAATPGISVDLISFALLMGFVYAYFIMVPSVIATDGPSPQSTLLALVQLQRFILAAGLTLCLWYARGTPWRRPLTGLAAGASIGFFLRLATSEAISQGQYREGTFYDLAWIVPFMCYLWAALETPPSQAEAAGEPVRGGWRAVAVAAAPIFLIPLIGFSILRLQPLGDPGDSVRLLLTVLSTVCGLGILTLRLSVESGELERADARIRMMAAATEQTADLILITRANGEFEHANDACVQALGYTRAELAGMTLPDLLQRGLESVVDHIGQAVRQKGIWRGTLVHRRKDGTTFPASSTVVALRNGQGRVTHFVGVQRDVTEDLRLRDQLVHSERLSAVGELVAGVAHEINNPLQTIIGCVELMIEERPEGSTRDLELVRQEATRAGQIVRNLLSFVRRGSPDRRPGDLNQIANAIAQLREHHLADRNVVLRLDLHPAPLPVLMNREEIQQIVLNLVLNAEHALGESAGTITIRTRPGGHMQALQVSDDGPGVPAELRGRVFEPFFTTKDVGQGTGLGLSIALGIATAHGGALELLPSATGACFQLTLPSHQVASAALAGGDRRTADGSGLRALVIEDERSIRALLSRLLSRRGYQVTEAASCAEAKAAMASQAFDLVLSDVRLGDGNGAEILREARRTQPGVERRFVFVTGDIAGLADTQREFGELAVLTKPFTATDLDRLLNDLPVTA